MIENLVIGSESMIGSHTMKILPQNNLYGTKHSEWELLDFSTCKKLFSEFTNKDTVVYNYVGFNGGLPLNLSRPADIYYQSTQLNLNILKCCQLFNVKKVISVISACAYPDTDFPMKEENLGNGFPNESVECHGYAKKTILDFSRQLYKQYKLKNICTILTNSFGDGDRFDLNRTKVVGAIVKKLWEAKKNNLDVVIFYGTGLPIRELMYSGDAAQCLVKIANVYEDYMNPINIGSGQLFSIKEVVNIVSKVLGYEGNIIWDTDKPDGQAFRGLDLTKMKKYIQHEMTPFEEGIKKTVEYYENVGRFLDR